MSQKNRNNNKSFDRRKESNIGRAFLVLYSKTIRLRLLLGVTALILTGCSASTIIIEGSYPSPLTNKLPLTLGVYYSDELRNFTYIEINDRTGKDEYIVNSGSSQVELFNTLLPALFEQVVLIEDINAIADYPNLDAVFVPAIEQFQVGLPEKTRLDVYEVWVKYNMRLSRADGNYIADWEMTAYGKSPTETFQRVGSGVNDAAVVALRDLAASFTFGFQRVPEINEWLAENALLDEDI